MPENLEVNPTAGMSYGREMAGVKASTKTARSTVELMAGTGLKYVHATSKGRVGVPGDLEKSRAALLKLGHVHKENFDDPSKFREEKQNNTVLVEKAKLDAKLKEDNTKAYEEWIQQKELKEQALKCLHLIPKPVVDYSEHLDDYELANSNRKSMTSSLRRSLGGGTAADNRISTLRASQTVNTGVIPGGGGTGATVAAGGINAAQFNATMSHFNINHLLDCHPETLEHIIEIGKHLKKVDRTLFVDWMKWSEGVIPNTTATVLWDFFAPMACDVHSSVYSQVKNGIFLFLFSFFVCFLPSNTFYLTP
jgi:hypothetical protein